MKKKTFPVTQTILDHDGYVTAMVFCPICTVKLNTYNFGKPWCIGGVPFNERPTSCACCGAGLNWEKIPYPTGNFNPRVPKGESYGKRK